MIRAGGQTFIVTSEHSRPCTERRDLLPVTLNPVVDVAPLFGTPLYWAALLLDANDPTCIYSDPYTQNP